MKQLISTIREFLALEAFSGFLLAFCTALALMFANGAFREAYHQVLEIKIGLSLHHWINDGLMAVFFFVVGMEIKKEIVQGELSTRQKAALPIAAALGGMIAPALIYFWLNPNYPQSKGWGIPMATDIAFAVAVLSFFRVPLALRIFLLALAIVDDLGAVMVIALFYTKEIHVLPLVISAALLVFIEVGRRAMISNKLFYFIIAIGVWVGILLSGVHATIAGVLLGFLVPYEFVKNGNTSKPLSSLIHTFHPWVSYCIMPIFALANAGITLDGVSLELLQNPIHQGVALGLLMGKPLGIFIFAFLAVKIKLAQLPSGVSWLHILGVGCLGGIGFTMALFISSLALYPDQEIFSKTGILLGSLVAAILGSIILASIKKADS